MYDANCLLLNLGYVLFFMVIFEVTLYNPDVSHCALMTCHLVSTNVSPYNMPVCHVVS